MPKRIADLRPEINTLEEAEGLLKEIALAQCVVEAKRAKAEKRIAEIKSQLEDENAFLLAHITNFENQLRLFIEQNKKLFEKRRKHKCDWGTFGLQKASGVVITDEEALVAYAAKLRLHPGLLKTVQTPIKSAVEEALNAGVDLPGCSLKTGDTAVYTVAKALIDEAKETA